MLKQICAEGAQEERREAPREPKSSPRTAKREPKTTPQVAHSGIQLSIRQSIYLMTSCSSPNHVRSGMHIGIGFARLPCFGKLATASPAEAAPREPQWSPGGAKPKPKRAREEPRSAKRAQEGRKRCPRERREGRRTAQEKPSESARELTNAMLRRINAKRAQNNSRRRQETPS